MYNISRRIIIRLPTKQSAKYDFFLSLLKLPKPLNILVIIIILIVLQLLYNGNQRTPQLNHFLPKLEQKFRNLSYLPLIRNLSKLFRILIRFRLRILYIDKLIISRQHSIRRKVSYKQLVIFLERFLPLKFLLEKLLLTTIYYTIFR